MGFSRRSFLSAAALGGAGLALPVRARLLTSRPDTIILAKTIYTMDPANPVAQAIALSGEHILALGSHDEIRAFAGPGVRVMDARGSTVFPGFQDSHSHPMMADDVTGVNCDFTTIADLQAALRARAARTRPGDWISGYSYDDTRLPRPLRKEDLDAVSTTHPILVMHRGGHTGVVNSLAFKLAKIDISTPDPATGKYYRENGQLTGLVAELALEPFSSVPGWPVATRADYQKIAELSTKRMAAAGLTSVTDAGAEPLKLTAYTDALHADALSVRLSVMPWAGNGNEPDSLYNILKRAGIRSGDGDHRLRIGAVKYAADGSASERTMRISAAYPGKPDDYGILRMDQAQLDEAARDALANGYRMGVHANGDVTIAMVLTAYEKALKGYKGPNPRLRIEHCSLVNPELLGRIKAIGAIPTPFYTYAYYHGDKWHYYDPKLMDWMFAHKSFLDYGIPVAPASDYLPGPYEPLMALQSMTTRKDAKGRVWGAKQIVSLDQALRICTVNGAYASCEENIKGSLEPGKLADLVFMDKDPHDVHPDHLQEIKIQRTIMGGRVTHEA